MIIYNNISKCSTQGPSPKYHLIHMEVHYLDNLSVPVRHKRRWHWSNEEKCIQHIERIIILYLKAKREELGLSPDQNALLIFKVFKGQKKLEVSITFGDV